MSYILREMSRPEIDAHHFPLVPKKDRMWEVIGIADEADDTLKRYPTGRYFSETYLRANVVIGTTKYVGEFIISNISSVMDEVYVKTKW